MHISKKKHKLNICICFFRFYARLCTKRLFKHVLCTKFVHKCVFFYARKCQLCPKHCEHIRYKPKRVCTKKISRGKRVIHRARWSPWYDFTEPRFPGFSCFFWCARAPTTLAMRTAALLAVYILSCLVACVVVRAEPGSAAQRLIDDTATTNVQHLDLLLQPHVPPTTPPWFVGFGGSVGAGGVAVATIGHPLRRMLLHLRREGVELKEGMSWAERGGVWAS